MSNDNEFVFHTWALSVFASPGLGAAAPALATAVPGRRELEPPPGLDAGAARGRARLPILERRPHAVHGNYKTQIQLRKH